MSERWTRTRRGTPCPICEHVGWCSISPDGAVVKCMRVAQGAFTSREDGSGIAYYHRIRETDRPRTPAPPMARRPKRSPLDFVALADTCEGNILEDQVDALAAELGVSAPSLRRLRVGWLDFSIALPEYRWMLHGGAFTFPMVLGGKPSGLRLRLTDARDVDHYGTNKIAVPTSAGSGIFVPEGLTGGGPLVVCEGPTDCAALLDLGFDAVGRPSNTAGTDELARVGSRYREVVILRDRDRWGTLAHEQTRRGAEALASRLADGRRGVRLIVPPGAKDARAWLQAGATRSVVDAVIRATAFYNPIRPTRPTATRAVLSSFRTAQTTENEQTASVGSQTRQPVPIRGGGRGLRRDAASTVRQDSQVSNPTTPARTPRAGRG